MSGGSMNYLYSQVQDANFPENTAERVAFRKHLELVAKALRAIEWNDSGDGDDREEALILAVVGNAAVLEAAIELAHTAQKELTRCLERACSERMK